MQGVGGLGGGHRVVGNTPAERKEARRELDEQRQTFKLGRVESVGEA